MTELALQTKATLEADLRAAELAYEAAEKMPVVVYYGPEHDEWAGEEDILASAKARRAYEEAHYYASHALREAQEALYWWNLSAAHQAGYEENGPDLNAHFDL